MTDEPEITFRKTVLSMEQMNAVNVEVANLVWLHVVNADGDMGDVASLMMSMTAGAMFSYLKRDGHATDQTFEACGKMFVETLKGHRDEAKRQMS